MLSWLSSPQASHLIGEPLSWVMGRRGKGREVDLAQVNRVLVVRLDEIGDVVMTTPFLRELRRNLPDAWITLIVKPAVYNLVELCPYVNEVLTYDWNTPRRNRQLRRHGRALKLAWKHLWRRHFDLAIVPRWAADHCHATFVAYFSGAPWRVGYSEKVTDLKQRANSGFDRLLTHVLDDNTMKHEVEHNLDVIRFLGGRVQEERLELWVGEEDEVFAEQVLKSSDALPDDLLIAFGPGAREPKRTWPLSNFVELGAWLKREYEARIMVVGGPGEEPLGQQLQRQLGDRVINAVGRTTLRQTGALLKQCHLYVGNDAGPLHMAAAASVSVVEISCHPLDGSPLHPRSPRRFGPWGVPYVVLQPEKALAPCSEACTAAQAHCILGVTVEQVKEAVMTLLPQQCDPVLLKRVLEHAG